MRSSRRSSRGSHLAVLLVLLLTAAAPPGARTQPRLVETTVSTCRVIHPGSLSPQAAQVAEALPDILKDLSRRLGAPPLASCRIFLVTREDLDDDEEVADVTSAMPEWAAGIALPEITTIVIRVDRVGPWRQRSLVGVLAHETAHLLMAAAAGAGADRMPPWFREGVASNLARDGEWLDFFYLWLSPIPSSDRPLADLGGLFEADTHPVLLKAAYAGSFSFMRAAMARHTADLPGRVLDGLRRGLDFERAWFEASGVSLAREEEEWSASIRRGTRWAAILTSSATLWLAVTLLVLLAWLLKRRRAARVLERWQEEDPYG